MRQCVVGAQRKRDELGEGVWGQRRLCMLAGQSPDELRECVGRVRAAPGLLEGVHAGLAVAACDHAFLLVNREFGGRLVPPTELVRECVEQLEAACEADPVAFERQARCITSARNLDELERCEPP
ncbi:hypothetical protein ENSA7_39670 [Enhygromyxa salina]|uniref:Uncharacterized protein n=2 Tax=Enhygromyxa salina TaxID=215803 RepID=A0A2S9YMH6_9BACT|nr:hypothetical protein ENSA7_39670 [Enhygromyxa salina]